jgi:hypothetical protein
MVSFPFAFVEAAPIYDQPGTDPFGKIRSSRVLRSARRAGRRGGASGGGVDPRSAAYRIPFMSIMSGVVVLFLLRRPRFCPVTAHRGVMDDRTATLTNNTRRPPWLDARDVRTVRATVSELLFRA